MRSAGFLKADEAGWEAPAQDPPGPLLPRFEDAAHAHMDRDTTAWWALDVSAARAIMKQVAAGDAPPDWALLLLQQVRIVEVDLNVVHAVAPYGGGRDMIGRAISEFWPPESCRMLAEVILAAAVGFPPGTSPSRAIPSLAFSDATVNASVDPTGNRPDVVFISAGGVVADNRSLWALKASELRYSNLIHHLPFALLQVDSTEMLPIFERLRHQGISDVVAYIESARELPIRSRQIVRVTDANINAVELFGAKRVEDLIAPVDYVFAAAPETARRVIRAHFEGRRSYAEAMKVRRFDGQLIDVEIGVTYPTPPERLEVTLITLTDISERLRTEAQLRQLQADYTRAARISMLGELATSIAHEVNQPLSAIVTNAETSMRWMNRDVPNLAKAKELTGRIAESGRHASDIVKRIRAMAARQALEPALLDLGEVVAEALHFVRHDFETRSIGLSLDIAGDLPRVMGDRVQLQQVIVNLLINAQQAPTPNGENRLIEIGMRRTEPRTVTISVEDNGAGIAQADLGRLFDSFFTTKHDGVGIGLAICQSIIAAHGGTISVRNRSQGGAAFSFTLPIAAQQ